MSEAVIFAGTYEGRKLAEFCKASRIDAVICVVSDYGEMLLPKDDCLRIIRGPMDLKAMSDLIAAESPEIVIDATHPYAKEASSNIRSACIENGTDLLRVRRESLKMNIDNKDADQNIIYVDSVNDAVSYLENAGKRRIFITTGSKELEQFTVLDDYKDRIFVRVLPDPDVLTSCEELGIPKNHIIAMQGPFSEGLNYEIMDSIGADCIVTKESGAAGGFAEKINAALRMHITAVVIGRPDDDVEGVSLEEAISFLGRFKKETSSSDKKRIIYLIGIGMGGAGEWTLNADKALREADSYAGAKRMLESVAYLTGTKPVYVSYDADMILQWFFDNPKLRSMAVVYSGDTGFYSGAAKMCSLLNDHDDISLINIPGVSTLSYLCSRLNEPWQDVFPASLHGRDEDVVKLLKDHEKVFLLLDSRKDTGELCKEVSSGGYPDALISVGVRLSYPDECIITDKAVNLTNIDRPDSLSAILIRRDGT